MRRRWRGGGRGRGRGEGSRRIGRNKGRRRVSSNHLRASLRFSPSLFVPELTWFGFGCDAGKRKLKSDQTIINPLKILTGEYDSDDYESEEESEYEAGDAKAGCEVKKELSGSETG